MAFTMSVGELIDADTTGLLAKHPSWERVRLSEVASILNGAPFDSALFDTTNGVPLVRIRDVLAGATSTYYKGEYEAAYVVRPGDLLVGMDGDFNSGFWGAQTALLNQRVCRITPDERYFDKRLMAFLLPGYLAAINANTPSVTVKHLSSKTVGEIELPLPPFAEQARIVAKLEELLSDLDAGVAELKAAQAKLAQYRQSLLKAAVSGELTTAWRREHPATETGADLLARILRERLTRWEHQQRERYTAQGKPLPKNWQNKYPEPVPPDVTDLPELPQGWVWASLGQLVAESSYGTSVKCSYEARGCPVLRIPNVSGSKLNLHDMKFATQELQLAADEYLETGDVLVIRTNGSIGLVGRAAPVTSALPRPHYFASYLLRLRCMEKVYLHRWMVTVMLSGYGRRWIETRAASSAGQHNISLSTLLTMPVPLPALDEQCAGLALLDDAQEQVADQQSAITHALAQAGAQRQNLLRAAFAGELVPQDPRDEPAIALLARIRAERAAQGAVQKPRGRKTKEAV